METARWYVLKRSQTTLAQNRPMLPLSPRPKALVQPGDSPEDVLAWMREQDYDCHVTDRDPEVYVHAKTVQ